MKIQNQSWYYYGGGMSDFGRLDSPQVCEMTSIKKDEVLARVDAVAICASDIKMIHMGNAYPLFKDRDFNKNPAILGHELSLTVMEVGEDLQNKLHVGMRLGVQPDVYMDQIRYCIGVNVQGGMQKYMILDKSVFYSDHGMTVFPIEGNISHASVAQLEPNACVEAAYRSFTRQSFDEHKKLLIYVSEDCKESFILDMDINHKEVLICGSTSMLNNMEVSYQHVTLNTLKESSIEVDDLLLIGNPSADIVSELISILANDSVFCWLQEFAQTVDVSCDIAKIHYSKINFIGCTTRRLSDAFDRTKMRCELKQHGKLLIMGGAGAMGRIHTLRAILHPKGPDIIVVTARSTDRLSTLLHDFHAIALQHGKQLYGIATNDATWKDNIQNIANEGFDDIVVCAPGINPVDNAVPFLKEEGMLVLFSGTKYGSYTLLPIGSIASRNCRINASSGSSVEDEITVLQSIYAKQINPDKNVVGIAGFKAMKAALLAVDGGKFPGKVIVYPQIDDLPLYSIEDIARTSTTLGHYVNEHGWDSHAESLLYEQYACKDKNTFEQDVVHFGGGALGRGLVIPLLHQSGKNVILVDTCEVLLQELKAAKSYQLDISNDPKQRMHDIPLKEVYSSIDDIECVIHTLKRVHTVTTSVRRENLIYIAKTLARAWSDCDGSEKRVICCENVEHVGEYFKELLLNEANTTQEKENLMKVVCPDTIVDRICATSGKHGLQITSETFYECSVDRNVLEDTHITCIQSVNNIEGHFYRKRYLLNAYADCVSFIAKAKGYQFLYEAMRSEEIQTAVKTYLNLLCELLDKKYNITKEESREWLDTYRKRLSNDKIPREIATVARNLWTKLSLEERFVAPLIELKKVGYDIQEGLAFILVLLESENTQGQDMLFWDQAFAKLKESWCITTMGEELFEEIYKLQKS